MASDAVQDFDVLVMLSGQHRFHAISFDHNNNRLATSCGENIHIWKLEIKEQPIACQLMEVLKGHDDNIHSLTFSSSCQGSLFSCSKDGTVRCWDVPVDRQVHAARKSAHVVLTCNQTSPMSGLAISQKGLWIASASMDGNITVIPTGKSTAKPLLHSWRTGKEIRSLSSHGDHIAVGYRSGRVQILEVATGAVLYSSRRHQSEVTSLAYNIDGKLLASGSWDMTIKISRDSYANEHRAMVLNGAVFAISFSPSSEILAYGIGAPQNSVFLWYYATNTQKKLPCFQPTVSGLHFSSDGSVLAYTAPYNKVVLWDMLHRRKRLAIAMSTHWRLGAESSLFMLELEILRLIVNMIRSEDF